MHLYIVRHGDAIDPNHPSVTHDEMRGLTARGRDEVGTMARLLTRLGVTPTLILASPFVRTRQTAWILSEILEAPEPVVSDHIAPGGSPSGVLHDLGVHEAAGDVIVAGHMPGVGALAGYVAWGDPHTSVPFRTAEVCRIDVADGELGPGMGELRWLIPPRIAEKLLPADA